MDVTISRDKYFKIDILESDKELLSFNISSSDAW